MVLMPNAQGRWAPAPAAPGTQTEPGLIVYRFGADLFYANADRFADEARALVGHAPTPIRHFIIDASAITDIDYSAARTVLELFRGFAAKNIAVAFGRVNPSLRDDLDRHGVTAAIGEACIFATLHQAIDAARQGGSLAGPKGS